MATGVIVHDKEVRKMFADLKREISTGSGAAKKQMKRFLIYKKAAQKLPFKESGIRDENGAMHKWAELSDDKGSTIHQKRLLHLKKGRVYLSPKGKRIQAPWCYQTNAMKKIPKSDYEDKEITRKASMPLVRSGLMRDGLTVRVDVKNGKSQFVQSVAPRVRDPKTGYRYPFVHFFGAQRTGQKKTVSLWDPKTKQHYDYQKVWNYKIPARPFLSWAKKDLEILEKFLLAWVGEKSK